MLKLNSKLVNDPHGALEVLSELNGAVLTGISSKNASAEEIREIYSVSDVLMSVYGSVKAMLNSKATQWGLSGSLIGE